MQCLEKQIQQVWDGVRGAPFEQRYIRDSDIHPGIYCIQSSIRARDQTPTVTFLRCGFICLIPITQSMSFFFNLFFFLANLSEKYEYFLNGADACEPELTG